MSDLISRDDAIKAFEENREKAREDREYFAKYAGTEHEQAICNEAVKAWEKALLIVKQMNSAVMYPQVDGVTVTVVDSGKNRRRKNENQNN